LRRYEAPVLPPGVADGQVARMRTADLFYAHPRLRFERAGLRRRETDWIVERSADPISPSSGGLGATQNLVIELDAATTRRGAASRPSLHELIGGQSSSRRDPRHRPKFGFSRLD